MSLTHGLSEIENLHLEIFESYFESGPELIVVPQQRIQANHSSLNIYFSSDRYNVLILITIIRTLPQHPSRYILGIILVWVRICHHGRIINTT